MDPTALSLLFAAGLFAGMTALIEAGRHLGRRRQARDPEGARAGLGAIEGAVFGLMGLLIAFTFSGAAARFDARRHMIVQEANTIGTAWLRLDLLPAAAQPELRALMRQYVDLRLATYRSLAGARAMPPEFEQSTRLQGVIWRRAVDACQGAPGPLAAQVLPALNDMFDIASTRMAAVRTHAPSVIYVMLGALALMSSLLAGYAMAGGKARSWIHTIGFALIMAVTAYIILDLEFPRKGLIRLEAYDQGLYDVRKSME